MSEDLVLNLCFGAPPKKSSVSNDAPLVRKPVSAAADRYNHNASSTSSQVIGSSLRRRVVSEGTNIRIQDKDKERERERYFRPSKEKIDDDELDSGENANPLSSEEIAMWVKKANELEKKAEIDPISNESSGYANAGQGEEVVDFMSEHVHPSRKRNFQERENVQDGDKNLKKKRFSIFDNKREKSDVLKSKSGLLDAQNDQAMEKERNQTSREELALFDTQCSFSDLLIHPWILDRLENALKITNPTQIQKLVIPKLVREPGSPAQDLMICSSTGSGKTLAYVLPILQNLQAELKEGEKLIDRGQGLRALILAPTRELCVQIEEVIRNLSMRFYWIVSGTVMGGEKKKSEKARLRKGVTILVATPGRLLDHLKTTEAFKVSNLSYLVFDESDRLMDLGFEKAVMEILDILKFKAAQQFESGTFQTIMLSATQTQSLEGFSRQLLKNPEYVSIANASKANAFALPETLQHGLIEVGYEKKFSALLGFLTWKIMSQKDLKAIIFMTACDQVEYFYNLFIAAEVFSEDVKLHMLHGSLPQVDRTQVFLKFCSAKSGILICTNVAARGLDLPEIDWSIQFDAPEDIPEYVHRGGRTARRGRKGRGLIFLSPSHEIEFANVLQDQQILLRKVEAEPLLKVGGSLMLKCFDALKSDPALEQKAHAAFVSFVRGYSTYPKHLKHIFHPNNLHLGHVARSFLLREAPSTIAKIFNHNHQPRAHSTQTSTKRPMNTKFNALSEFMM